MYNLYNAWVSSFGRLYTKSQTPKAVIDEEVKNPSEKHESSLFNQLIVITFTVVYNQITVL